MTSFRKSSLFEATLAAAIALAATSTWPSLLFDDASFFAGFTAAVGPRQKFAASSGNCQPERRQARGGSKTASDRHQFQRNQETMDTVKVAANCKNSSNPPQVATKSQRRPTRRRSFRGNQDSGEQPVSVFCGSIIPATGDD